MLSITGIMDATCAWHVNENEIKLVASKFERLLHVKNKNKHFSYLTSYKKENKLL